MTTFTITTPVNGSSLTRLGSVAGVAWTRVTTTATVTQTAHGLLTNDRVSVTVTSDAGAIVTGVKTVTVSNANVFTFTCLNGGAASGTITLAHIDDYDINGGYLTIDQHTRYGVGQNTSASLGNVTLSATLGGTIEINSTLVRLIPYDTGSSTVPAYDTTISQGSASGKLIGVYDTLASAPTAVGAAMPANGYILVRQWNSVAYSTGALTGIGASATAADRAGWLEIVGTEGSIATINRLNVFKVRGDYYDFFGATTDGTRTTTYQLPTNGGSARFCPGVEVETGTGTGVYEFYPCAGTQTALVTTVATDYLRGRWCWISTAGLVSFGYDGTNSTGGYIPPAGRKIRVPNIFFVNATSAALTTTAAPNATLTSRYTFATTGGGVIDIDKACLAWYCNFQQPYSMGLTNTFVFSQIQLAECATAIAWSNVGVGQEAANTQIAFFMSACFAGGTIDKCTWTRAAQAGSGTYVNVWSSCFDFIVTNERTHSLTKAGNATSGSYSLTNVFDTDFTDTVLGGGRMFKVGCVDMNVTDTIYYDHPALTTSATIPMYAFDIGVASQRIKYDGLTFGGLSLVQPYSGILNVIASNCTDITLQNLGTAASPLDMGGPYVLDATWARVTTVMTVTNVAHGLKVGDLIAININSDVAPLALTTTTATLRAVATVPTADTFTITVTNTGSASGTLSYYPTMANTLVTVASGACALDINAKRCYVPHLRTGLLSADNSNKNIVFDNVWGTEWNTTTIPALNVSMRGVQSTHALTAQTSVYGTHFIDCYTTGTPVNMAGVAWTRVTTTATITSSNHGMRTGDLINVTVTDSAAAIILGQKTITATTSNTFTFTCLNAGNASGVLTFVPYNGRIQFLMNEATVETASQVALTGTAAFTSAGGLFMPTINDQVVFTLPSNVLGHSQFPIAEAIMAGGTMVNYHTEYSLDGGSTYHNLYYPRAGGGGSNASTNVTMTSTTGVAVDDYVFGTNIAPNAKVASITNGTTVVVDKANVGAVSGVLRFNHLPHETVADSSIGFPFKLRVTTVTANATAITSMYLFTSNVAADRAVLYPLNLKTLTLTGLLTGSDIVILQPGTSTEYSNTDSNVGTTFDYVYDASIISSIDIAIYKAGYIPFFIRNYPVTSDGETVLISQVADRAYI